MLEKWWSGTWSWCNDLPFFLCSGHTIKITCDQEHCTQPTTTTRLPIRAWLVCSTSLLAPRIGLYTAYVISLKDTLIGWSASDYDASIQLWHWVYTLLWPMWRVSSTSRKQKAFPLPGTAALWLFWKSREFPAFFRGRGQSYARRHGTWNSLGLGLHMALGEGFTMLETGWLWHRNKGCWL